MSLPASIEIVEVGARDGLQNEAMNVPTPEKVAPMEALTATGIGWFEATSFVWLKPISQLDDAQDVLTGLPSDEGVVYCVLPERVRLREDDGERAEITVHEHVYEVRDFVIRAIEGGARRGREGRWQAPLLPWVLRQLVPERRLVA